VTGKQLWFNDLARLERAGTPLGAVPRVARRPLSVGHLVDPGVEVSEQLFVHLFIGTV